MKRYHLSMIDSTNDWAKRNLNLLDHTSISLVTADAQSAGRGRFGRTWYSPEHQNIYATFVQFIDEATLDQAKLVQTLATITQKVLANQGIRVSVKWPNDLFIGRKKVAGILLETVPCTGNRVACLMGIGLNVNMPKDELAKLDQPATSLLVESNTFWDKDLLINALVDKVSQELKDLERQ